MFSLSCRALGREVEDHMVAFLKQRHSIREIEFAATDKNADLKELFEKEFRGFK